MVTRRKNRTECELVTYGTPWGWGIMALEERNILVNDQITRIFRKPSKASLIHFSLVKEISRGQ